MNKCQQNNKENPVNLKQGYQRCLERSFVLTLFLFCFLFFAFPSLDEQVVQFEMPEIPLIVEVIPPTEQNPPPPRPKPPMIPVEADADDIMDPVTIDFLDLQEEWIAEKARPVFEEDTTDIYEFIAVSEKPKIIKSVAPVYPDLAQRAGVTGQVVVKVLIGKNGDVEQAEILKSVPMLDEAAQVAAWQLKFTPGKQRDRFVKVWMAVPFNFTIAKR
jgi:protein TonB